MIQLKPPFRRARPDDARALAELVNFASWGLAHHLWSKVAGPGGDPWAVGRERVLRGAGNFTYRNAVVAEVGGRVAACLIGFPLPAEPQVIPAAMPPMFVPLQELENLAPGSWYVNELAAYPEHRGQGLGAALLGVAERLAAAAGKDRLGIIVTDANTGARRLYERCGYAQAAERLMIKNGWQTPATRWFLLTKHL